MMCINCLHDQDFIMKIIIAKCFFWWGNKKLKFYVPCFGGLSICGGPSEQNKPSNISISARGTFPPSWYARLSWSQGCTYL